MSIKKVKICKLLNDRLTQLEDLAPSAHSRRINDEKFNIGTIASFEINK